MRALVVVLVCIYGLLALAWLRYHEPPPQRFDAAAPDAPQELGGSAGQR